MVFKQPKTSFENLSNSYKLVIFAWLVSLFYLFAVDNINSLLYFLCKRTSFGQEFILPIFFETISKPILWTFWPFIKVPWQNTKQIFFHWLLLNFPSNFWFIWLSYYQETISLCTAKKKELVHYSLTSEQFLNQKKSWMKLSLKKLFWFAKIIFF